MEISRKTRKKVNKNGLLFRTFFAKSPVKLILKMILLKFQRRNPKECFYGSLVFPITAKQILLD